MSLKTKEEYDENEKLKYENKNINIEIIKITKIVE